MTRAFGRSTEDSTSISHTCGMPACEAAQYHWSIAFAVIRTSARSSDSVLRSDVAAGSSLSFKRPPSLVAHARFVGSTLVNLAPVRVCRGRPQSFVISLENLNSSNPIVRRAATHSGSSMCS